jgi:histidyl-tRNA synthetase
MPSTKTQPARGMRDFLPEDVRRREYVIGIIKEVYERYGFEPLETPAVENIETLMGKYGEEGNQLIFKILKRGVHEATGEADLALRYDLTVPLARVVAEYKDKLPKFFKRYQIQPVWRADRPARGRFREFYQCDVDVLGSKSMVVEAEVCAAASEVLVKLGFDDFTIRLNHRQVLTGLLDWAGVPSDIHVEALVVLDKFDKITSENIVKEFKTKGVADEASNRLITLKTAFDSGNFSNVLGEVAAEGLTRLQETLKLRSDVSAAVARHVAHTEPEIVVQDTPENLRRKVAVAHCESIVNILRALIGDNDSAREGVDELSLIVNHLRGTAAVNHIRIDPGLARGLSYYTGAILEIAVKDLSGSLGGGGRYDNLVGMFLGQDVPACGFSLGLERIIVVMTERGMFPPNLLSSPADVMVTIWNEDSISEAVALAHELRAAGLRVDLYPEADKVGKQFKYASSRGIPFVAVIGDDERARGEVAIKDMQSGEQRSVKRESAAAELRKALAEH